MSGKLNRSIEFRGLAQKQDSDEKSWFYYEVGTKPWLAGYYWIDGCNRQFVGKVDSQGKKIYEGDVLLYNHGIIGVVLFIDSGFMVISEHKNIFNINNTYTVIGNVDEHDYLKRKFQDVL